MTTSDIITTLRMMAFDAEIHGQKPTGVVLGEELIREIETSISDTMRIERPGERVYLCGLPVYPDAYHPRTLRITTDRYEWTFPETAPEFTRATDPTDGNAEPDRDIIPVRLHRKPNI